MSKQKVVVFLKSWRGYNRGESAGFDENIVEKLISAEIATSPDTGEPRRSITVERIGDEQPTEIVIDPPPPPKSRAKESPAVVDNSDRP